MTFFRGFFLYLGLLGALQINQSKLFRNLSYCVIAQPLIIYTVLLETKQQAVDEIIQVENK